MTNQVALAIKIIKEDPETLALKFARNNRHCSDCPANDICIGFSDTLCEETIEKWLKSEMGSIYGSTAKEGD